MLQDKIKEYLQENKFNGDFIDDANYITGKDKDEIAKDIAEICNVEYGQLIFTAIKMSNDCHDDLERFEKENIELKNKINRLEGDNET